jgi:hypothetical protein
MVWMGDRDGIDAHRLEVEIANEPQWVVFHDCADEDRWAADELEEITLVAAWWSGVRP